MLRGEWAPWSWPPEGLGGSARTLTWACDISTARWQLEEVRLGSASLGAGSGQGLVYSAGGGRGHEGEKGCGHPLAKPLPTPPGHAYIPVFPVPCPNT